MDVSTAVRLWFHVLLIFNDLNQFNKLNCLFHTRFEVSKRNLSSEQLPEAEGIAEHVCLHRVASALCKHFRSHPAKVLHMQTHIHTQLLS